MSEIFSTWEYIGDSELAPEHPPTTIGAWEALASDTVPGEFLLRPSLPSPGQMATDLWLYQDNGSFLVPRQVPTGLDASASFAPSASLGHRGQVVKLSAQATAAPSLSSSKPRRVVMQETAVPAPDIFVRTLRKLGLVRGAAPVPSAGAAKAPAPHIAKSAAPAPSASIARPPTPHITRSAAPVPSAVAYRLPAPHIFAGAVPVPSFSAVGPQLPHIVAVLAPTLPFMARLEPLRRKGWGWRDASTRVKRDGWREEF